MTDSRLPHDVEAALPCSAGRDPAFCAGCFRKASVQRYESQTGCLCERHIAGVVDREVLAEFPCACCQEVVWPHLDIEVQQISVGLSRLIWTDLAGELVSADDVGGLVRGESGCQDLPRVDCVRYPLTVGPTIEQKGRQSGCVADEA